MKTFFLSLAFGLMLIPNLSLLKAATTTETTSCAVARCHCEWNKPPILTVYQTGTPGMPDDIVRENMTEEQCRTECVVISDAASPEEEAAIQVNYTCEYAGATTTTISRDTIYPRLNVPLPGLGYEVEPGGMYGTPIWKSAEGKVGSVNLLGVYIQALYSYILLPAAIVATTMLMIGGLQYAFARGDDKQVSKAKDRINKAIIGVVLLLLAYNIGFLIDPATVTFKSLNITNVAGIRLNDASSGPEGYATVVGGSGTWENLQGNYKILVQQAKQENTCFLGEEGFASPTGTLPNQGHHHWETLDKGDAASYKEVKNLDWAAGWGQPIMAPFSGTVTYEAQKDAKNKCGNRIYLKAASGDMITICHVKDYLGSDGQPLTSGQVVQGQVLGHLGGECCAGSGPVPAGWVTKCDATGTMCPQDPSDPAAANCSCQSINASGNTTGPHVHVTWSKGPSNILSCLK